MKMKLKKYPLLVSMIISCVIIIASLFVLGFAGMKLGTSLGGGSSFELIIPNDTKQSKVVSDVKSVLSNNGLSFDSATVESKYVAIDNNGNYTTEVLVVKISNRNVSDSKETAVIRQISEKLGINAENVSSINNIIASTTTKQVLMLGLAIGIVALALFVLAWIRYDVFAGLTFIISFLHNIIVYLSLLIITRVEFSIASLVSIFVLTLVMSIVLIHIFEKYRTESRLHISDKLSISERMIGAEIESVKPFIFVCASVIVLVLMMLFVPATVVKFTALSILIALIVTAYTTLIIAPSSYVALLEFIDVRRKAVLSRNDTVNKVIKKKIKNSKKAKEESLKKEEEKVEIVEETKVVEEKPKKQKTKSSKKETQTPAKKKTVGQKTYKKDYSKFKK